MGAREGVSDVSLLAAFARFQRQQNLRPGTIDRRYRLLRAFERAIHKPLSETTAEDIEGWLERRKLTVRSRYTYLTSFAVFFAWATHTGACRKDPTRELVRPRLPRLVPRPANGDDLRFAMDQAPMPMKAWLCLGAYQGLRCYEMAGLHHEDVVDGLLLVRDGKGGHQRLLPLHPETAAALRLVPSTAGPLFLMQNGSTYRPGTISTYIGRYFRSLGIGATAHQLRHWFGTSVYQASHDLRLTQELMGHADPKTTAIYAAYSPDAASSVVVGLSC